MQSHIKMTMCVSNFYINILSYGIYILSNVNANEKASFNTEKIQIKKRNSKGN